MSFAHHLHENPWWGRSGRCVFLLARRQRRCFSILPNSNSWDILILRCLERKEEEVRSKEEEDGRQKTEDRRKLMVLSGDWRSFFGNFASFFGGFWGRVGVFEGLFRQKIWRDFI